MIERDFVRQKKREYQVKTFITSTLKNVGHSFTELQRTPLGDKVIIHTSRPGLIVGRKGQNISKLTDVLKTRFNLENPQVEISEVEQPNLDASIVAERIASALERFGSNRFKGIMHKTMADVLASGAQGVEIRLSGKLPSSRAKSWRVGGGNLKKCGDAALTNVRKSIIYARLKSGVIGIQVNILPPGVVMPDSISMLEEKEEAAEKKEEAPETQEEEKAAPEKKAEEKEAEEKKEKAAKKKPRKRRSRAKKAEKKEEKEDKEKESKEGGEANESS